MVVRDGRNARSREGGMEYRFKAAEWKLLTRDEKARRCRLTAKEARDLARGSDPGLAGTYLQIAEDWLKLANEIEAVTHLN